MGNNLTTFEENGFEKIISEDDEPKLINQLVRKTIMLKEFRRYVQNCDEDSIYHKHMLGTLEYTICGCCSELEINELCSNFLVSLYKWPVIKT